MVGGPRGGWLLTEGVEGLVYGGRGDEGGNAGGRQQRSWRSHLLSFLPLGTSVLKPHLGGREEKEEEEEKKEEEKGEKKNEKDEEEEEQEEEEEGKKGMKENEKNVKNKEEKGKKERGDDSELEKIKK